MATLTLKIPTKFAVWFRAHALVELGADMDQFPSARDVDGTDLETGRRRFENAQKLNRVLDFDFEVKKELSVELDSDYVLALLKAAVLKLGEDMLVASGHYPSNPLDLDEVARVSERAIWLVETLDEHFTGWPENGGDRTLSPWVDVRDEAREEAVA